jgi:hypothetical protein
VIQVRAELAAGLDSGEVDPVRAALQTAIELEHSTIPPYLYALYSLMPGANDGVAAIIESIVVEEMLHLTLAANVLNALGGSPVLDRGDLVPRYPGPLPGSVEGGLVVGLAPCSLAVVHDVFMVIEEPDDPLEFPAALAAAEGPLTIGQFYERIKDSITLAGDAVFTGDRHRQIGPGQLHRSVVVTDVASARRAIDTIVDQGEGTRTEPLEVVGADFAHYYRFAEIYHGRRLVPNPAAGPQTPPDERYLYGGDPIPFDPAGVFPVPTNPDAAGYPSGGAAQQANQNFNYTYTNLLKVLHASLNGAPRRLDAAIGLMMSLEQQAKDMVSGSLVGGECVGPTFQYQPVNG